MASQAAAERAAAWRDYANGFADASEGALANGDFSQVPSGELTRAITAAIKLYAAKSEAEGAFAPPVSAEKITPTEVVVAVSEMLRAADLNLFDLAMWYRRPRAG